MRWTWVILLQACATSPAPLPPPAEVARDEYELSAVLFPGGAPPRSMEVVEMLVNPVMVKGWTFDRVLLADGRQWPLAGLPDLRRHSFLLAEATRDGVELLGTTAIGLLRVNHWCGNDPIARHVARVDLVDLLLYHEDETAIDRVICPKEFSPMWGWDVGAFHDFRDWQRERAPAPPRSHARYIARRDADVLVIFSDRRALRAQGSLDIRGRAKVRECRLPDSLWTYLEELRLSVDHLGAPPHRIDGDFADFVFDVLRRQ